MIGFDTIGPGNKEQEEDIKESRRKLKKRVKEAFIRENESKKLGKERFRKTKKQFRAEDKQKRKEDKKWNKALKDAGIDKDKVSTMSKEEYAKEFKKLKSMGKFPI